MSAVDAPVADWVTIPELYRDPFPTYERLRAEGGVHWVPAVNRYLITSYEAVHETEFDQTVYSANEEGSLQIRAMGHSMLRRDDPEHMIERRAPRHTCTPLPNARWGFAVRWMLNRSASGHTLVSRFAESRQMPRRAPFGRRTPVSSTSRVVWREYIPMGATQRMVSSNTVGHREGSASTAARCSGWVSSAQVATPSASRGSFMPPADRHLDVRADLVQGHLIVGETQELGDQGVVGVLGVPGEHLVERGVDLVERLLPECPDVGVVGVVPRGVDHLTGTVRTIHLIGRSQPQAAKFDPVMVRELAGLRGVRHVVHSDDLGRVPEGKDARVDAVRSLATGGTNDAARVTIHWWFGYSPERIDADGDTITALHCSTGTSTIALAAGNVITAIGFQGDDASPVAPGSHPDGRVTPGLYVAGWLRRGPRGTIPDQRTDSLALASLIANDISAGEVTLKQSCRYEPRAGATDFDGWRRIDLLERLGAAPGRERSKMRTTAKMLEAAGDLTLALPDVAAGTGAALATRVPVTIAFATESGGAELVAEELAQAITGDVDLLDLSHAAPGDLDPGRFLILIASTYGDGEIPSGALPFYEALQGAGGSLAGLRYSVFGMGDRSYDRTYSRASELLSEALEAAGATRVGEYGRHDAGGPEPATDAALDWVVAIVEEAGSIAVG